jgi:hypothetical protein
MAVVTREWTPIRRRGWVLLWLWQGSKLSERDVARMTELTKQGANQMMLDLAADFPLVKIDGKWQWMEK